MDNTTLGVVATIVMGVVAAVLKMHSDLINKTFPAQFDRLIAAGSVNNDEANKRHADSMKGFRLMRKELRKLKKRKCREKPFQNGPPRHAEQSKRPKTRPK